MYICMYVYMYVYIISFKKNNLTQIITAIQFHSQCKNRQGSVSPVFYAIGKSNWVCGTLETYQVPSKHLARHTFKLRLVSMVKIRSATDLTTSTA